MINVICCVCGALLGLKAGPNGESHTYCTICRKELEAQIEKM